MPEHSRITFATGTQVVITTHVKNPDGRILQPAGSVAVVVSTVTKAEGWTYQVRFSDGLIQPLSAADLEQLDVYRRGQISAGDTSKQNVDLFERVILRCVIGSRAYGLETQTSDTDYRGVYLPPTQAYWSLTSVPEQLECDSTQEAYWELKKFLVLALKANPNVLECLYSPMIVQASALASDWSKYARHSCPS